MNTPRKPPRQVLYLNPFLIERNNRVPSIMKPKDLGMSPFIRLSNVYPGFVLKSAAVNSSKIRVSLKYNWKKPQSGFFQRRYEKQGLEDNSRQTDRHSIHFNS